MKLEFSSIATTFGMNYVKMCGNPNFSSNKHTRKLKSDSTYWKSTYGIQKSQKKVEYRHIKDTYFQCVIPYLRMFQ